MDTQIYIVIRKPPRKRAVFSILRSPPAFYNYLGAIFNSTETLRLFNGTFIRTFVPPFVPPLVDMTAMSSSTNSAFSVALRMT